MNEKDKRMIKNRNFDDKYCCPNCHYNTLIISCSPKNGYGLFCNNCKIFIHVSDEEKEELSRISENLENKEHESHRNKYGFLPEDSGYCMCGVGQTVACAKHLKQHKKEHYNEYKRDNPW